MKEIKVSNMFQTGLVYNYSKAEDLKIIVDEEMPEGVEINIKESVSSSDIKLIINGDVGKEVKIRSLERKVDVIINGDMKENASIELNKGNVIVRNVNNFVHIEIKSGCIMANTVGEKAYLDTQLGCIISENVENGGQLEVGKGFITANTVGDAKLRAKCGKVYINEQDNRTEHNKGWEKFSVTLPIDSATKLYDRLNNHLSEMNVTDNNEIMNDVFNGMNFESGKINQPTRNPVHIEIPGITVDIGDASRVKFGDKTTTNYYNTPPHRPTTSSSRNSNAPRSSNFSSSGHTFYTNVPTQGLNFNPFSPSFSDDLNTIIRQAAASGNTTRLPNANNLQFGNTYHIDANQSPQRQTTASRGTGANANQTQAQQAATSSHASTNVNQRSVPQMQPATASQDTGDMPPEYHAVLEHNIGVAVDEHPLYQSNNVSYLPSYQDVVGSGAAAANNNFELPPAYSEKPREDEQTITETIHNPSVSQSHMPSQRR